MGRRSFFLWVKSILNGQTISDFGKIMQKQVFMRTKFQNGFFSLEKSALMEYSIRQER